MTLAHVISSNPRSPFAVILVDCLIIPVVGILLLPVIALWWRWWLLLWLLWLLAVVLPVLVAVVRFILALLVPWDWSCASFDVLVDLLVDSGAAASVIGIAGGIVECAGIGHEFLDNTELLESDLRRFVLPWEDAWLDDLPTN